MAFSRDVQLTDRLRWSFVAAPVIPTHADGRLDPDVCRDYFRRLVHTGASGLAISAPTGRVESADVWPRLVRDAADLHVPVVVGADGESERERLEWVQAAAEAGADALLVTSPPGLDGDALVAHHDTLWKASGLPLIAVDAHPHPHPPGVLARLLEHPGVAALQPARMHDAIACQASIAAARARGVLVLSGEPRMLGPSLMWGAEGVLLPVGGVAQSLAALVKTFAATVHTPVREAAARFLDVSAVVNELGRVLVRPPYDGQAQRMLWIGEDEGAIPPEFALDPSRPAELDDAERDEVIRVARLCREQVRQ